MFIGLSADLPKEYQLGKTPIFCHGTNTSVLIYFKHTGGLLSTGELYERYIYPMSGPLGGDLDSTRENVGLKVVSGLLNNLDRNVFYTTYGASKITTDTLAADLSDMIRRKALYYKKNKIFGLISRMRYWNDEYYKLNFKNDVESIILPILKDDKSLIVQKSIENIILADKPVLEFTKQEKYDLNRTHPLILCSEKMAKYAEPAKTTIEVGEVYIKQLLKEDIDLVYTSEEGCSLVRKYLPNVKIICRDELFYGSHKLTIFQNSSLENVNWSSFYFLDDSSKRLLEKGSYKVSDFKDATVEEAREILKEVLDFDFSDLELKMIIHS